MRIPSYMDVIGSNFPNIQCHCIGTGSVYRDIIPDNETIIPIQSDLDLLVLIDVKTQKIMEFSENARVDIESGFTSSALGTPHTYDSAPEDQLNLIGVVSAGDSSLYASRDIATGIKSYNLHTLDQLKIVLNDGKVIKLGVLQKFLMKKQSVLDSTTITDVIGMVW